MPASRRYIQSVLGSPEASNTVARVLEPAATIATATAAEPVAGIAALLTGDADTVGRVQDRLTYNPRSKAGQEGLKALSDAFVEMAEAIGIDDAVAYFEDTVVPSLQSKFGDEVGAAMGAGLMAGAAVIPVPARKIKAYHGSPHDFDQFSTDAIGTGEGAQMYGHGLYFADREQTARNYRDQLTPRDYDYEEWLQGQYKEAEQNQDYARMQVYEDAMLNETPEEILDRYNDPDYDDDMREVASEVVNEIREYGPDLGRMYEVELSVSDRELLDWDKAIVDQPQEVIDAIKRARERTKIKLSEQDANVLDELMKEYTPQELDQIYKEADEYAAKRTGRQELYDITQSIESNFNKKLKEINQEMSDLSKEIDSISISYRNFAPENRQRGEQLLKKYDDLMGEKSAMNRNFPSMAAKLLNEEGIKGVKYADAFTRHKTNGKTFNYVIFDDRVIEIAKKYGVAVPAAAVMLSEITGDDPESLYEEA